MKAITTEAHIQEAVVQFLELDGWRAIRTDPVSDMATVNAIRRGLALCTALRPFFTLINQVIDKCVRGKGFGDPGMPDYLFVRYGFPRLVHGASLLEPPVDEAQLFELLPDPYRIFCDVFWIEFKRPGAKPKPHQDQWHAAERARGALVRVVDDIDAFQGWYLASGLNRRLNVEKRRVAERQ